MDDAEATAVFAACSVQRRAFADLLEGLDDAQLATPSLCAGWDVRTVGAHLAAAASPAVGPLVRELLRHGLRAHRANDALARQGAERPVADDVAALREHAGTRSAPPVIGPRGPLTDLLVHTGDVALPLGLAHEPDLGAVRAALAFVTRGRPVGFVRRGALTGLRLDAEDVGSSWGDGERVAGRGIDLVMAACGRTAVLDRLSGPGVARLRDRAIR